MKDETEPLSRGELMTDEATPQRLVRVCAVVAQRIERGEPWKLAAVDVLQALARASWSDAFLPVPGLRARRTDESRMWRPAYPAGADAYAALMKEWKSSLDVGIFGPPPALKLTADEASARGMECDARSLSFWEDQGGMSKEQAAALPALPVLRGPAGLRQLLHEVWTHARKCTDLAAGLAGEVLMLESDAAALCGYEVAAEHAAGLLGPRASSRPSALATASGGAVEVGAEVVLETSRKPGAVVLPLSAGHGALKTPPAAWTPERMRDRLAQLHIAGQRAPMVELLAEMKCDGVTMSARQVQRRVKPLRDQESASQGPWGQLMPARQHSTKSSSAGR